MILYPAIDLQDGKCVRLVKGQANESTIYNNHPAVQAKIFEECGCQWLHVVDLDGAFGGKSVNTDSVADILAHISVPIQLGGGIRDMSAIERWLDAGISRIVLGTIAVENPDLVKNAAHEFPNRIAVGIDARQGFAATHGWITNSKIVASDLAQRFEDCGVAAIIYTDIDRDGIKSGPNIPATLKLAQCVAIPVIASGGISSLSDLSALQKSANFLNGVIIGRALYDGTMSAQDALLALRSERSSKC